MLPTKPTATPTGHQRTDLGFSSPGEARQLLGRSGKRYSSDRILKGAQTGTIRCDVGFRSSGFRVRRRVAVSPVSGTTVGIDAVIAVRVPWWTLESYVGDKLLCDDFPSPVPALLFGTKPFSSLLWFKNIPLTTGIFGRPFDNNCIVHSTFSVY